MKQAIILTLFAFLLLAACAPAAPDAAVEQSAAEQTAAERADVLVYASPL